MKKYKLEIETFKLIDEVLGIIIDLTKEGSITIHTLYGKIYNQDLNNVINYKMNGIDLNSTLNFSNIDGFDIENTMYSKYIELLSILKFLNASGYIILTYSNDELNITKTILGTLKHSRTFTDEYLFEIKKNKVQLKLNKNQIKTNKRMVEFNRALVLIGIITILYYFFEVLVKICVFNFCN